MNQMHKRGLLYGGATLILAAIGYTWANRCQDADVMTLLSSVDVQLRLANAIPALDLDGKPLASRLEMITSAEQNLAIVERLEPGLANAAEFTGFAHMLRGRFADAAIHYERAQQCKDCADEQRDVLAFNQARMLAQAGQKEQALAAFAKNGPRLDRRYGHQRALEEAAILRQLGRRPESEQRLLAVVADTAAMPMASLQAGTELLEWGNLAAAEVALARAESEVPIAAYYLARLKLQQNDVDTALGLLERAAKVQPTEVRRRLSQEAAAWSAIAADARFQELKRPPAATPVR